MAIEYRPLRPEELDEYVYSDQVGFGGSTASDELQQFMRLLRDTSLRRDTMLAAFEDGAHVAHMAAFSERMSWNGREIDCGAIVDVMTLPTHRRRGHVRELMTRLLATIREAGQPVAMLWASMAAIYQRFGFGIAVTLRQLRFDPRQLRFVDEIAVPGRVRLVTGADAPPLLARVYERFAASRTCALRRSDAHWRDGVLQLWKSGPPALVAVYEEQAEVLGYAVYRVEHTGTAAPGPWQQLQVPEFVALTPAAHRGLVQLLAGYDLARTVHMYILPVDDPLLYQAQEPRLLNAFVRDGTLVRIVDVQAALEGRGYDGDGRLTFALHDGLCPWNTGSYTLSVEAGAARLQRTDAEPSLRLTPRALAIIATGRERPTTLARMGIIPDADPKTLRTADAIFSTAYAPFCPDQF